MEGLFFEILFPGILFPEISRRDGYPEFEPFNGRYSKYYKIIICILYKQKNLYKKSMTKSSFF